MKRVERLTYAPDTSADAAPKELPPVPVPRNDIEHRALFVLYHYHTERTTYYQAKDDLELLLAREHITAAELTQAFSTLAINSTRTEGWRRDILYGLRNPDSAFARAIRRYSNVIESRKEYHLTLLHQAIVGPIDDRILSDMLEAATVQSMEGIRQMLGLQNDFF